MSAQPASIPLPHGSPPWLRAAQRARRLSWLSLLYMAIEGTLAVIAAIAAGSAALLGFGIDSVIEAAASIIVVWRLSGSRALSETAERRAQYAVAVSFFLLAPYIAYEAISKLAAGQHAETTWLGIVISALSLAWMPVLGMLKKRLGSQLGSGTVAGEGTQNLICGYQAGGVLLGLLGSTLLG